MPSPFAIHNDRLAHAHIEALTTLCDQHAAEADPLERRKLAIAILRTRPLKDPTAPPPAAPRPSNPRRAADAAPHSHTAPAADPIQPTAVPHPLNCQRDPHADNANTPKEKRETHPSSPRRRADRLDTAALNDADDPDDPDDDFDDDTDLDADFDDPNDPAMQEINDLAHQLEHGPDPLAALNKLHAIMRDNFAATNPDATPPQSS